MTSTSTLALLLPTIMAVTLVTVTPLKSVLEVWVTAANRAHDAAVQLLALVVGVGWAALLIWATGPMSRNAGLQIVIAVIMGLSGGSASIGAYHVATTVTRSRPSTPPPTSVPQDKGD